MRVLVTGADGFVGRHLVRDLEANGHAVLEADLAFRSPARSGGQHYILDVRDPAALRDMVGRLKPDACVHLAGLSFAPAGSSDPASFFAVNVMGTVNLLDAFRRDAAKARILFVSTAHVYGESMNHGPLAEDALLRPVTLYASSKAAADLACSSFARNFGMHVMSVRPNNHIGPGQSTSFVVASFAQQIRRIARGEIKGPLKTGNLESTRDFTDVRDVVRAYRLLLERGHAGAAYNLSSGSVVKLKDLVDMLSTLAGVKIEVTTDPERFRSADNSPLLDVSRLRSHTGWKPEIGLKQTLKDILADF